MLVVGLPVLEFLELLVLSRRLGLVPWSYHNNSAMFRLTYSTETSARVPSLDLGAYQAGDDTLYRSPSFSNGADGNSTEAFI